MRSLVNFIQNFLRRMRQAVVKRGLAAHSCWFKYTLLSCNPAIDVEDFGRKMLKTIPTTKFYTGKKNLKIEN